MSEPTVPAPFVSPVAEIVRTEILGEPILFTITDRKDLIQKHHLAGGFYEEEELEIIRQWCRPGSVFCDIGANIGNHSLYALKFLRVRSAILFEPNPIAINILRSNLELNNVVRRCDLSNLGVGLSDTPGDGLAIVAPRKNLGAGRLVPSEDGSGSLKVVRGDDALAGRQVDFIKIDVEGMEMSVLAGLAQTIARSRPRIFIEVSRENIPAFKAWGEQQGYSVAAKFKRYWSNVNFMVVPRPT